jgi:hypothetical protein
MYGGEVEGNADSPSRQCVLARFEVRSVEVAIHPSDPRRRRRGDRCREQIGQMAVEGTTAASPIALGDENGDEAPRFR